MQITRELLERYHRGECSRDEKQAVESWLEGDDFDDERELALPLNAPARSTEEQILSSSTPDEAIRVEIWSRLSEFIKGNAGKPIPALWSWRSGFKMAFAASVLVVISAIAVIRYSRQQQPATSPGEAMLTEDFVVERSSGTRAFIQPGRIDFCGLMRIEARHDVQVVLNSICFEGHDRETVALRKGETYLAFKHDFAKENELLVVNQRALDDLPLVVRRQLTFR